jgi:hypothetical protein
VPPALDRRFWHLAYYNATDSEIYSDDE